MTPAVVHWIQHPQKRKWHAWRHGEKESACGTLSAQFLREHPARSVSDEVTEEMDLCGTCKRIIAGGPVASWYGFIRRHLRRVHCTAPEKDLEAIAVLLTETGTPDEPEALELFEQIKMLLLTPMRTRTTSGRQVMRLVGLREALVQLPPNSGKLAAVADAVRVWRSMIGQKNLGNFRPDKVINVMLQVSDPVAYISHLKTKGLEPLGVMFHPNVLARAKKEPSLRGLFSGSTDYWKSTSDQLNIITDDD